MHTLKKKEDQQTKKARSTSHPFSYNVFVLFSFREVFSILTYLISVFLCCYVIFPIYGRKYSMKACGKHVGIFLLHTKLIFPCMQENFSYVFFLFHTKLIFPCMQGDLNKYHIRNIFVGYK